MKNKFFGFLRWIFVGVVIYCGFSIILTLSGPPLERLFILILVTLLAIVFLSDFHDDIIELLKKIWNSFKD
jgi:hypothetical protein